MRNNNFEEALMNLEKMSEKIKASNTTLEDAIQCYDEGLKYYNICNEILENAKQKIEVYSKNLK